jgi:hypothetical protein
LQELPHLSLEAVRGLKGTKEASLSLQLDGDTTKTVRVAVCSGVNNARKLVEDVRAGRANFDFVEVSECLNCFLFRDFVVFGRWRWNNTHKLVEDVHAGGATLIL